MYVCRYVHIHITQCVNVLKLNISARLLPIDSAALTTDTQRYLVAIDRQRANPFLPPAIDRAWNGRCFTRSKWKSTWNQVLAEESWINTTQSLL